MNRIYVPGPYAKILLEANPPVPGQLLKVYERLLSKLITNVHRMNPLAPVSVKKFEVRGKSLTERIKMHSIETTNSRTLISNLIYNYRPKRKS